MAVFDVPAGSGLAITATKLAFFQQMFNLERRVTLSNGAWTPLTRGRYFVPGDTLYFGPLDQKLEYQITGMHQKPDGKVYEDWGLGINDDGTKVVFSFEDDGVDKDYDDLVVVCRRITPVNNVGTLLTSNYNTVEYPDGGWGFLNLIPQ